MSRKPKTKTPPSPAAHHPYFELVAPTAREVALAGSFNDWHPTATPMIPLGHGRWGKELVLKPGRYEYRFVVDGHWLADPAAKECAPNPYGEFNSVLVVRGPTRTHSSDRDSQPVA